MRMVVRLRVTKKPVFQVLHCYTDSLVIVKMEAKIILMGHGDFQKNC